MSDVSIDIPRRERPTPVASALHTSIVVGIFAALAAGGAYMQSRGDTGGSITAEHPHALPLYLGLIVMELALVRYVQVGIRRRGLRLRDLIGGEWRGAGMVARDVAIAAGFWLVFRGANWAMAHLLGPGDAKSISTLLPQGWVEAVAWVAVSLTAGFAEELVFRGYLLRQGLAITGSASAAVVLQAVVFGIAHGYQGLNATLAIVVYGVLFALLALWRRSLRPGMLAHAWADVFGGLIAR